MKRMILGLLALAFVATLALWPARSRGGLGVQCAVRCVNDFQTCIDTISDRCPVINNMVNIQCIFSVGRQCELQRDTCILGCSAP